MTNSDTAPLTDRQRILSLWGIYISIFAWGMSFAGLMPLMSLSLENRGFSTLMIGYVGAVTPIGVVIAAPFIPKLIQKLGTAQSIMLASIGVLITVVLLPVFDSYPSWLVLRFLAGLFGAVPWVATETWINVIANEKTRGRITALYGMIMATSFAIGPVMLSVLGTQNDDAYIFCSVLLFVSLIPLFFIWKFAPILHPPEGLKLTHFIYTIPSILVAGFISGMVDMSFFSFLPIWGLRMGYTEDAAILLLSIFVLGNVALQLPIGWLADKTDRYSVLIGCGIAGFICSVLILYLSTGASFNTTAISIVLFIWGGCTWALYTLSLAILGARFKGGELTAAGAAFVVAYEFANIVGPPLSGITIKIWEPHGFIALMGACVFLFSVFSTLRQVQKRRAAKQADQHI